MSVPRSILDTGGVPDLDLALTAGSWPAGIGGEVFISTADVTTAGGGHCFFGDGVLVRLSLDSGTHDAPADRFAFRSAVLDSPSSRLRFRDPSEFAATPIGTSSPFGVSNASNTAPLPWGDRLFVTWDAGRPVEVDPVSLRWLADVGRRDDWAPVIDHPVLPLIASSAHPVIDPDRGCMWTVTHNPISGEVAIVRYSGEGVGVDRWCVDGAHLPQSTHTISQTAEWLILSDCAFKPDPTEIFGLGPRGITNNRARPVFLVRKADLDGAAPGSSVQAKGFELSPETMHFYAAYDDTDGVVVVFEHTNETDLCFAMRSDDVDAVGRPVDPRLVGMYNHPMSPGAVAAVVFDPERGTVTDRAELFDRDRYWATQLSTMDWSAEGQRHPTRHHQVFSGYKSELVSGRALDLYEKAGRVDPRTLPSSDTPGMLVAIDRDTMASTGEWAFADDDYPCSPCFVPRRSDGRPDTLSRYAPDDPGGHDGWVMVPVLSDDGFRVELFDAAAPDRGPEAVLSAVAGETVPFLLHAAWMPAARPSVNGVERLAFADDLDERLDALPDHLAASAREVAAELAG